MKTFSLLVFLLFTGSLSSNAQEFEQTLQKVKELKNSQYPGNKALIDLLQKNAVTDQQKGLGQYYLSIYYVQISEYDSALHLLEKVRTLFKQTGELTDMARAYRQSGVVYYSFLNDFVQGKAYLDSARTLFEKAGNKLDVADCLRHEATIYYYLGDIDRSNDLLIKILPEYTPGTIKYLDIQDLIVNNYIAKSDFNAAYGYSKNIPEAYLKINEPRRYAYSLMIRGHLQKKKGLIKEAEQSLLKSIEISEKNEYLENMIDNNRFLGMLYTETGEYSKAEHYLNQALFYTRKVGDSYSLMHIYASLSRYYLARHDFINGDYYANEATAMGDSLFKEENNYKLAEYEALYKTADKEIRFSEAKVEIARKQNWIIGLTASIAGILVAGLLLWRTERVKARAKETERLKNLEIENQNRLITARELERKRIAKELHDSVGSQLTIVSTSLDNAFYLFENQKLKPEKLENINTEVRLAAQSLRDTIWATYNTEVTVADFKSRIQEFIRKFTDENSFQVQLEIRGDEIILTPIEGLNLFRIVQEAINNTQKYSGATLVRINGLFTGKYFSLEISDNGRGFEFSSKDTSDTFGLNNMKLRAEEVGAKLKIESKETLGTRILVKRG